MNQAIRARVAERLSSESTRKHIERESIVRDSGLSEDVVTGYLTGTLELCWDEFRRICQALEADPIRLLLPDYKTSRLAYRNATSSARREAARIENAFLMVRETLPKATRPRLFLPAGIEDPGELLTHLIPIVTDLRERHGDTTSLYEDHKLPVLGVQEGNFDAFLMACKPSYLVCVNLGGPDARIEFSLLHEFCHFIFDADREVPIDIRVTGTDLYGNRISEEARPEYIANKFAQLWLIPYESAQKMAKAWPNVGACADYVREHRISPDVVINALYDVLRFHRNPPSYRQIQQTVQNDIPEWRGHFEVRDFVKTQRRILYRDVAGFLEDAQEGRREEILSAWGLADGP
uniref:Uncharacterized protein n=1 Tax=Candidatus Kentrum sp. FW TaxID=2126338 RepID=A0A450SFJ1_9GAMM|nr:MAG: protein of unknown function (DUF955) [Candidatus Kentron sp. FW]